MSSKPTAMVVDDEVFVRDSLVDLLENEGYRTVSAGSASEALKVLAAEAVSVVITDLRMPSGDGLSLLAETKRRMPDVPVILLTGVGTVPDAVLAMKSGAYDFILKPVDPEQFVLLTRRAIEHHNLVSELKYLKSAVKDLRGSNEMVGESAALTLVQALVAQVAPTNATVLITGESGTGKELVAAEVHRQSARAERNFVSVNCAAIPENLFESEFFGHRRGAFTSATSDRLGRFAEAEGGTVTLDEIATLKPDMQAKLLRVLETGEYQVLGESRTRIADVRVIAITNEDLAARVREGVFRKDLYFRLNVFPIEVPPLRQRKEDIPRLADHFLLRARGAGRPMGQLGEAEALSKEACEVLCAYDWPGNVRELRNVMERASILSRNGVADAMTFRRILAQPPLSEVPGMSDGEDLHIRRRVDALERRLIEEALARAKGKKREAAVLLGIDAKNIGYYLRKHGMAEPAGETSEEGTE